MPRARSGSSPTPGGRRPCGRRPHVAPEPRRTPRAEAPAGAPVVAAATSSGPPPRPRRWRRRRRCGIRPVLRNERLVRTTAAQRDSCRRRSSRSWPTPSSPIPARGARLGDRPRRAEPHRRCGRGSSARPTPATGTSSSSPMVRSAHCSLPPLGVPITRDHDQPSQGPGLRLRPRHPRGPVHLAPAQSLLTPAPQLR